MREGANGSSGASDVGESCSEGVVPVPFAGDSLKCVYVIGNLTFINIEVGAGPGAELLN